MDWPALWAVILNMVIYTGVAVLVGWLIFVIAKPEDD